MTSTSVTWTDQEAMVFPAGDVVAACIPELRSTLRETLAKGARQMTIDFTRVEMVDSTGIGLLISAHNSMSKSGGKLAVINASGEILELFHSMRIHQHFPVSRRETAEGERQQQ